jgi:hypothetical protein
MVAGCSGCSSWAPCTAAHLGYDAVQTGAAFLPVSLGIGVLSLGFSARPTPAWARAPCCCSDWWRSWPPRPAHRRAGGRRLRDRSAAGHALLGAGAGIAFPALMTRATSGATASDSGSASGLVNTAQQVGGALGLAVLAILDLGTNHPLPTARAARRR